jgi:hypothetical protein
LRERERDLFVVIELVTLIVRGRVGITVIDNRLLTFSSGGRGRGRENEEVQVMQQELRSEGFIDRVIPGERHSQRGQGVEIGTITPSTRC